MMLFRKEFNKVIGSISYLIFIGVLVIALYSQGVMNFREDKLEQPQTGQYYGVKSEEIPELIMPAAMEALYQEFSMNSYVTYPIGFYKKVRLNDSKQEEIAQILSDLTGIDRDSILYAANESVEEGQEGGFIIGDSADMTNNGDGSFSVSWQEEEPEEREVFSEIPDDAVEVASVEGVVYMSEGMFYIQYFDKNTGCLSALPLYPYFFYDGLPAPFTAVKVEGNLYDDEDLYKQVLHLDMFMGGQMGA